ncbi:MAG: DNA-processing protein DprA [Acidobacteriota bacterium]
MSGSAIRWAALNLRCAGRPALRRAILERVRSDRRPARMRDLLLEIAGPGWREAGRSELDRARRHGAALLTLEDPRYPALLRASADPPPALYVRGDLAPADLLAIAVVGSRRCTPFGEETASRIAGDLARRGFTVVSGLARGIDAAGHRGALRAGGRTIAVLGSGVDRIYPVEHRALAAAIAASGALLSEFPIGTPPLKHHFPQRNRVIAWLSWSTVVVEGARDSGSLITAGLAADEGRLVHAVPGPAGAIWSEGTNALLREGALLCRGAEDIAEDLAPQLSEAARLLAPSPTGADRRDSPEAGRAGAGPAPLTEAQRRVLARLPEGIGVGVDRLAASCGMAAGPLLAVLLELEIRGLVKQLPGRVFVGSACKS